MNSKTIKNSKLNGTDCKSAPTEPLVILRKFINEMYQWYTMCQELEKNSEFYEQREKVSERLNAIFSAYLTIRDRKYGRQVSLSFGNPPEYNLATNEILSCTIDNKKAFIEVQETVGFKNKLKYTLCLKKDGWRIDKKEIYDEFDDKWEKGIL